MNQSLVQPVSPLDATDKVAQTYDRIREMTGDQQVPEFFQYLARVPAFLHDFYMNFKKFVLSEGKLDQKTKLLIAIATAGQLGSPRSIEFLRGFAAAHAVGEQDVADALAVGATNSMYNMLFKFRDISGSTVFDGMSVGLRAHTFQGTALAAPLVELINLTLSDLNGCKPCTAAHVVKARQLGLPDEAIYEAVQCAATIVAGTQFLRSLGVA